MNKKMIIISIVVILVAIGVGAISILTNRNNMSKDEGDKMNTVNINSDNMQSSANNVVFNFETKTVKLNSGYEMPILGLGTWTQNDEQTANSVY